MKNNLVTNKNKTRKISLSLVLVISISQIIHVDLLIIKQFGTVRSDVLNDISVDSSNNSYFCSSNSQNSKFGKYDATTKTVIWQKETCSTNCDRYGTALDTANNLYITGVNGLDACIYKINSINGNQITSRDFDEYGYSYEKFYHIKINSSNIIYLVGTVSIPSPNSPKELYIIKLDSNLNRIWTIVTSNNQDQVPKSIALDKNDNIYITGIRGDLKLFLAKYKSDKSQEIFQIYSDVISNVNGIAVDNYETIYMGISYSNKISIWKILKNNLTPNIYDIGDDKDSIFDIKITDNNLLLVLRKRNFGTYYKRYLYSYDTSINEICFKEYSFPNTTGDISKIALGPQELFLGGNIDGAFDNTSNIGREDNFLMTETFCDISCNICEQCKHNNCLSCGTGYYKKNSENFPTKCYNTLSGYYFKSNEYYVCDTSCAECTSSANNCSSCKSSYYKKNSENFPTECYNTLAGYYVKSNEYYVCDTSCA